MKVRGMQLAVFVWDHGSKCERHSILAGQSYWWFHAESFLRF